MTNDKIKKLTNIHPFLNAKINYEELISTIQTPNLNEMMQNYKEMVKRWASYVNLKLNNDHIKCPITLYNEVHHAEERLELINHYQSFIEFCAILQGILDEEVES